MEYVDKQKLLASVEYSSPGCLSPLAKALIQAFLPEEDVVKVVRCKNCRYFLPAAGGRAGLCQKGIVCHTTVAEGFCEKGVRRRDKSRVGGVL